MGGLYQQVLSKGNIVVQWVDSRTCTQEVMGLNPTKLQLISQWLKISMFCFQFTPSPNLDPVKLNTGIAPSNFLVCTFSDVIVFLDYWYVFSLPLYQGIVIGVTLKSFEMDENSTHWYNVTAQLCQLISLSGKRCFLGVFRSIGQASVTTAELGLFSGGVSSFLFWEGARWSGGVLLLHYKDPMWAMYEFLHFGTRYRYKFEHFWWACATPPLKTGDWEPNPHTCSAPNGGLNQGPTRWKVRKDATTPTWRP